MKRHRILAAACAACLCVGLSLPARAAGQFDDVSDTDWYAQAAEKAAENGLMTGTYPRYFNPAGWVSRATVVTVLWRLEGAPDGGDDSFSDSAADSWYASALAWAKGTGIAAGDGQGCFRPDAAVSRQELAVFLQRYAQYKGETTAAGVLGLYADAGSVSAWAEDGMKHAVGAGLITGTAENRLDPWGAATRAQLAVILERLETPAAG